MKRRARGTGTVEEHQGSLRLRLPPSLNPKRRRLKKQFPVSERDAANEWLDRCVVHGRKIAEEQESPGITMNVVWPRYMAKKVNGVSRKRGMHAGHKARSHLEGVERNWLSEAPFWNKDMALIRGEELTEWFRQLQATGRNAHGLPVSDSWILQIRKELIGVFEHLDMEVPDFDTEAKVVRGQVSALNLRQQKHFFRQVIQDETDRIMAGCMMGAGLRKGELLSLRLINVYVGQDPHVIIETGGAHLAPTKSLKARRVELFEPGLGFFRLAVRKYRDNPKGLLFSGPKGGYMKHWPDKFKTWSDALGMKLTSHMMRHSYAYSMLSGAWGYSPQNITFVSKQLGHTETRTTEESYGHWDPGTGLMIARVLRGENSFQERVVTAAELLGEAREYGFKVGPSSPRSDAFCQSWVSDGRSSNWGDAHRDSEGLDRTTAFQAALDLARAAEAGSPGFDESRSFLVLLEFTQRVRTALELVLDRDPRGVAFAIAIAQEVVEAGQVEEGASA